MSEASTRHCEKPVAALSSFQKERSMFMNVGVGDGTG